MCFFEKKEWKNVEAKRGKFYTENRLMGNVSTRLLWSIAFQSFIRKDEKFNTTNDRSKWFLLS